MKSLEERKADREKRLHQSKAETATSEASLQTLQASAETAVADADAEAGRESAPLAVKKQEPAAKTPAARKPVDPFAKK